MAVLPHLKSYASTLIPAPDDVSNFVVVLLYGAITLATSKMLAPFKRVVSILSRFGRFLHKDLWGH